MLDQLGNWTDYQLDADADEDYTGTGTEEVDQRRTHDNKVNEIYNAITEDVTDELTDQSEWVARQHDAAGNTTAGPKAGVGTQFATEVTRLHFVYDAWNRLAEVYDGGGGTKEIPCLPVCVRFVFSHRRQE